MRTYRMFSLIINYSCAIGASSIHPPFFPASRQDDDGDDAVQSVYTMENTMKERTEKGDDNGGN